MSSSPILYGCEGMTGRVEGSREMLETSRKTRATQPRRNLRERDVVIYPLSSYSEANLQQMTCKMPRSLRCCRLRASLSMVRRAARWAARHMETRRKAALRMEST
jgi:hypothetical protein